MTQTLKAAAGAFVLALVLAPPAAAQTTGEWKDTGYFNISAGYQAQSRSFTEQGQFSLYDEAATFSASHPVPKGFLFDTGAGARLWHNVGIGAGYSRFSKKADTAVAATLPNPLFYNAPRNANATTTGLQHTEQAVHVQLLYVFPVSSSFDVAAFAGPSFFVVKQDMVSAVETSETGGPPLYASVTIGKVDVTEQSKNAVGFNAGIDGTYRFARAAGVGVFLRYAGAKVKLPAAGGQTASVNVGGLQFGFGLRFRF